MTYILYATAKDGDGHVLKIGEYDDVDEISIRCGMFAPDVVITIEKIFEKEEL